MLRLAGRDGLGPMGRMVAAAAVSTITLACVSTVAGAQESVDDAPVEVVPDHVAAIYEYSAATAFCPLDWTLLGAVGAVASDHGRVQGTTVITDVGRTEPGIEYQPVGPGPVALDWPDTDGGAVDGDASRDVTVGPFQFLPQTWADYAIDGNGDGELDPNNLWDAAASASAFLCDAGIGSDRAAALTSYFGSTVDLDQIGRQQDELRVWADEHWPVSDEATPLETVVALGPGDRTIEDAEIEDTVGGDATDGDPATSDSAIDKPVVGLAVEDENVDQGAADTDRDVADTADGGPDAGSPTDRPSSDDVAADEAGTDKPAVSDIDTDTGAEGDVSDPAAGVTGDWNADGVASELRFELGDDHATLSLFDEAGRPYGRQADLREVLGPEMDSLTEPVSVTTLVGDWNGTGGDQAAVVVRDDTTGVAIQLDRANQPMLWIDLGPLDADSVIQVVDVPAPAVAGEFWKSVEIHDGTMIDLWRVSDIAVDASLAEPLSRLLAAASEDGIELQGWGWRSHAAQIELRRAHCADVHLTPADQCSPPTAPPGRSLHEQGLAIDFHDGNDAIGSSSAAFAWLDEHALEYGLRNLPSEPWHWSTTGG